MINTKFANKTGPCKAFVNINNIHVSASIKVIEFPKIHCLQQAFAWIFCIYNAADS